MFSSSDWSTGESFEDGEVEDFAPFLVSSISCNWVGKYFTQQSPSPTRNVAFRLSLSWQLFHDLEVRNAE